MNLTHLDENNRPKMVDVSIKENTQRIALASGQISMNEEAYLAIISNKAKKRSSFYKRQFIAAIMAAKKNI